MTARSDPSNNQEKASQRPSPTKAVTKPITHAMPNTIGTPQSLKKGDLKFMIQYFFK